MLCKEIKVRKEFNAPSLPFSTTSARELLSMLCADSKECNKRVSVLCPLSYIKLCCVFPLFSLFVACSIFLILDVASRQPLFLRSNHLPQCCRTLTAPDDAGLKVVWSVEMVGWIFEPTPQSIPRFKSSSSYGPRSEFLQQYDDDVTIAFQCILAGSNCEIF